MAFATKLSELRQQIAYLRATFTRCQAHAYPNLAERLQRRLEQLVIIEHDLAQLSGDFAQFNDETAYLKWAGQFMATLRQNYSPSSSQSSSP